MSEYRPKYASIAINTPVDREFCYSVPSELTPVPTVGARVQVEFGTRTEVGVCVGISDELDFKPRGKIKPILRVIDDQPWMSDSLMKLAEFIKEHYATSLGEALTAVLTGELSLQKSRRKISILKLAKSTDFIEAWINENGANNKYEKQAKVLNVLLHVPGEYTVQNIISKLDISSSPIETLIKNGLVEKVVIDAPIVSPIIEGEPDLSVPTLIDQQRDAFNTIVPHVRSRSFRTALLHGITGSGKTEVYLHLIEEALKIGRGSIVLVPEIALTPQMIRVFLQRFPAVAVLHSMMTEAEKRDQKLRLREKEARIVIGPRSAVFAPMDDVGLIVVDEEHEYTYKQENTPRYNARDIAIIRAQIENCPIVLGSATPSLESLHNSQIGKYDYISMPRRIGSSELPFVEVVDLANEMAMQRRYNFLSRALVANVNAALEEKSQTILFLNRRGYTGQMHCNVCGHVMTCGSCSIAMTRHKKINRMLCHYCYSNIPVPVKCPSCYRGDMKSLGVGTEHIEEDIATVFPNAKVVRMDSDTMNKKEDYENVLDSFREGEIDILVGTQMVAKGLDFPNVTVIGIINADSAMHHADFRATEKTFFLLMQVAGRSGRGIKPGKVIIQTFQPKHPIIKYAVNHDYSSFSSFEMQFRKKLAYPPFAKLIRVELSHVKEEVIRENITGIASSLREAFPNRNVVEILGPAPCPIAKIRDKYRYQILIKTKTRGAQSKVREFVKPLREKKVRGVHVVIDVDPLNMM
ncbi:MAG: primosomal protein N' [Planctomycetes bacterium]|nr:primosomal protein N' [Planctomycetota bacterium]